MKKQLLALSIVFVMLFSCIPVFALNLETAEAAGNTVSESFSELQAITEEDALLYQPADNYGNLIGSISFDNQNAERDALSFAPALPKMDLIGVTFNYVEDPLGERDGYVAKATVKGTNRIALSIYNSDDLASLGVGKYTLAMDVYTTASTAKLSICRVDIGSQEGSHINDDIYNVRGAWNTVTVGFEITEVNGDEVTVIVDDAAYTEAHVMSSRPEAQIWIINSAETYVYFDDVRLYQYPENSTAWIDHMGNRAMVDVSEMTAFPVPSDIIEYGDDSEFYAWADESGNFYKAGDTASVDTLKYQTFTGVAKSYVYFENGDDFGEMSELEEIPYPSEVNSEWSDAGFYAWLDDEGNYRYPGDPATILDLADYTLTAVMTADYNATLPAMKMDGNGVILLHEDFENFGTDSLGIWQAYNWAYADSYYVSASNIKGIAAGTFTIVDEAGRGKVLKAVNTHRLANDLTLTSGKGTYKVVADVNSTFNTVRFDLGSQYQHVSVSKNTWATKSYSITGTGADISHLSIWASETGKAGTLYVDNIYLYYMPENAVVFDNADGTQVLYYGDANGNIVITAPSGVNANWSDDGFGGWTATNGSVYKVGDTVAVANLAGQVLKNEVEKTYFKLGEETASTVDVAVIPYPSELNSAWSDAGFYAWELDGVKYLPGTAGSTALAEKTLTAVMTADYNATLGERKLTAKGILVASLNFDDEAYTDKAFAETVTADKSSGSGQVADPFNSGRGNVYLASATASHWAAINTSAAFTDGKVRLEIDTYTTAGTYVTKQNDFNGSDTSPYPTSIKNKWYTHVSEYAVTETASFTYYRIWNMASGNLYIDNFKCYFMPNNSVFFENEDGTQAVYYGDANGNVVIPTPSKVNANWTDADFGGWTATNGTVYNAGQTVAVADLAGQVLKNEVAKTYFKFGEETTSTVDVAVIPYPSELNSAWSDAGFYAWELDGVKYLPGTAGSTEFVEKTFTAVMTADYNATLGERRVSANGILVASLNFDDEAYTDKAFAETITVGNSAGLGQIADPFSSGRGNVFNASSTTGGHMVEVKFDAAFANGKVRFEIDTYTDAAIYVTKQHVFNGSDTSPYPTSIKNKWYTHVKEYDVTNAVNFTYYRIWNGAGNVSGNLYIDNFKCYFMPNNAVVFDNGEAQNLYYGDANGKIKLPAPSGVNKNWSDDNFESWKLSDGTLYNIGDELNVADLAGKTIELVKDNDFAPIMLNKSSLRLTGVNGMRFASFVSMDARENAVEYGYIVSRKAFFADVDYDYSSNFVMPADFDTENIQGMLDTIDMPFLCGVAYKPSINKDVVYTTDGSVFGDDVNYGDGIYYTCVLTGMEGYDQYHETMVVRPFIKIGENYFYGTTIEKSLYDVALAYQQANGEGNAFVDGIVSATKD